MPGDRDRIVTEQGTLRPHINVFVNGEHIRYTGGLDAPAADGAEILLLPAISGGADSNRPEAGGRAWTSR